MREITSYSTSRELSGDLCLNSRAYHVVQDIEQTGYQYQRDYRGKQNTERK